MNTERRKTLTNERTGRKYVHLSQRQLPEKVIRQFIRNLIKTFLLYSTYLMHIQVTISIITLGSCQVLRASSWSKHFPLRKLKIKIYRSEPKPSNMSSPFGASSTIKNSSTSDSTKPDETEPMDFSSSPTFSSAATTTQSSSLRSSCENQLDISDCLSKFRAVSEGSNSKAHKLIDCQNSKA